MAEIVATSKMVFERNRIGQFAEACERAAESTMRRTVAEGARMSREFAPTGHNRARYAARPGYVPLKRSIKTHFEGRHRGYWYSIAPHAKYVEEGTSAHIIKGKLRFFWGGGYWYWNNPMFGPVGSGKPYENWDESGGWVRHPGTHAQPFLMPAYKYVVGRQMMRIAKEEFPG